MTQNQPPEFGSRIVGRQYQPRPGSYAVIQSGDGQVAVMQTPQGFFLPGGGAQPGESPEATLRREVLEECGHQLEAIQPIGFAIEYVVADGEGYFAKQCSFYRAAFGERLSTPAEGDHQLTWLSIPLAAERLTHRSQAWAVSQIG